MLKLSNGRTFCHQASCHPMPCDQRHRASNHHPSCDRAVRRRTASFAHRPDAVSQYAAAQFLAQIAARHFSVRLAEVCTKNRGRAPVALARQAAIYVAHVVLRMTYAGAGAAFGRDRTTAAHACRCIEDRRDDAAFDRLMARIERECAAALAIESEARGPDMSTMMADAICGVRA